MFCYRCNAEGNADIACSVFFSFKFLKYTKQKMESPCHFFFLKSNWKKYGNGKKGVREKIEIVNLGSKKEDLKKKIINSQGGSEVERGGCGGVKGQNIPSAPRVGQEQQSRITGKHLGSPLGGERICVLALD